MYDRADYRRCRTRLRWLWPAELSGADATCSQYPHERQLCFFFFFQAEDGIRDADVTGVQTCALPICRDVVIAALLGAEEFGFATAPLVVMGCVMMRVCHLNTCPVGIATQDPELRKKFQGKPELVEQFFKFIAQEVRESMAALGFRTMDEMIGRVDCLGAQPALDHWKARCVDLGAILHNPDVAPTTARRRVREQDHGLAAALDNSLIALCAEAIEEMKPVELDMPISNPNRTVGTMLGYEVTRRYGGEGLPDGTIRIAFKGSAG